jgi:hypothetical protein
MAVNIDELQVETQQAPAAPATSSGGGAEKPKQDLKSEMELLRERDLRLQAD